jgi:hypothetical protein
MLQKCQCFVDDTRNGFLLEHQDLSDLYGNKVLPNVQSYNNGINAWSHDKTENAPERAESILKALLLRRNKTSLDGKGYHDNSSIRCQLQSGERA